LQVCRSELKLGPFKKNGYRSRRRRVGSTKMVIAYPCKIKKKS